MLGYDVHVVAGAWHADGRELGSVGRLAASVPVEDLATSMSERSSRLAALLWSGGAGPGRPGPWAIAYEAAGVHGAIDAALEEVDPEVLVLRSTLGHLVPDLRHRVRLLVLDVHDADWFQARSLLSLTHPTSLVGMLPRLVAGRRVDRQARSVDEVWAPSQREVAYFSHLAPDVRVLLVPSGVRVPQILPERHGVAPELLLVGGFGYPPNERAAQRLVEEVLPYVTRRHPDAVVTLVGRDLRSSLIRRWTGRPVRWLGVVDDLRPLYRRAAALVLPYNRSTQTGTPLKVAEAVANGVPVVATPNAVEPLGLIDGEQVLVGETGKELAEAVVRLLDDGDAARALAVRAHIWARDHLAPESIGRRLAQESRLAELTLPTA